MYVSVCGCAVPLCTVSLPVCECKCVCVCTMHCSPHCIYLIMHRAKRLWDNSIFCSNWSFHLRAVLSNLISDKSVSHLQLNYNIELAFRLCSLVSVSSPPTIWKKKKKRKNPIQWLVVPSLPCRMKHDALYPWIDFWKHVFFSTECNLWNVQHSLKSCSEWSGTGLLDSELLRTYSGCCKHWTS